MRKKNKVNAAILIIGNEILSGRTQDTNTSTLSIWLNSLGIKVQEVRTIPDSEKIIVETVTDLRKKFDYVFTTGGIGPTHDDITASSIAKAFNLKYEGMEAIIHSTICSVRVAFQRKNMFMVCFKTQIKE